MKNLYSYSRILVFNLLLLFSFISFAQTDPPENFYVTPVGMASWDSITSNDFQFYKVFLDGVFITDTDSSTYSYASNSEELIAGESYLAEISALYNDGLSEKTNFEFVYLPCDSFPNHLFIDVYNLSGTDDMVVSWTDNVCFTPIQEDFESGTLPEGWMTSTNSSVGWLVTNNGSSNFWEIPEGDGYYACSNDDAANDDGSMDYLITPVMHFIGINDLYLNFSSFFNGLYGEIGTIEISFDGGNSWIVVEEVEAYDAWTEIQVDLSAFIGEASVTIAFHANDNGDWSSGWAVDNVSITASKNTKTNSTEMGTNLYLDDEFIAFVPLPDTLFIIQDYSFYGYHDICVDKVYTNNDGNHSWTSCYGELCVFDIGTDWPCYTPQNFDATESLDNSHAILYWNTPEYSNLEGNELLGYNIYRDGEKINDSFISDTIYEDFNAEMFSCYEVSAVFSTCGESELSNIDCIFLWDGLNELENSFSIYPNPAQNEVRIQSDIPISEIKIYNYIGQLCFYRNLLNTVDYKINIEDLNVGVYIIEFQLNNQTQKSKLIIH